MTHQSQTDFPKHGARVPTLDIATESKSLNRFFFYVSLLREEKKRERERERESSKKKVRAE